MGRKDKGVSERGGGADTAARGEYGGAERGDRVGARGRGGAGERYRRQKSEQTRAAQKMGAAGGEGSVWPRTDLRKRLTIDLSYRQPQRGPACCTMSDYRNEL